MKNYNIVNLITVMFPPCYTRDWIYEIQLIIMIAQPVLLLNQNLFDQLSVIIAVSIMMVASTLNFCYDFCNCLFHVYDTFTMILHFLN